MIAGRAGAWFSAAVVVGICAFPKPVHGSGLRLSIAAGMSAGTPTYREWHGRISLTVPFDTLLAANDDAPRLPSVSDGYKAEDAIADPPSATPQPEPSAPDDSKQTESASGTDNRPRPSKPVVNDHIVRLTPRLAQSTVAVARRVAGFGAGKRRLSAMASRARTSAILPELRLTGGRSSDASLRLSPTTTDPYRYTQSGGNDLYAEATLTWRLDRLLFADAELAVERILDGRDALEMKLVAEVLKQLFAWERAQLRQSDATLEPEQRELAAVQELEAELTLDVLTDGWFSRKVSKGARRP